MDLGRDLRPTSTATRNNRILEKPISTASNGQQLYLYQLQTASHRLPQPMGHLLHHHVSHNCSRKSWIKCICRRALNYSGLNCRFESEIGKVHWEVKDLEGRLIFKSVSWVLSVWSSSSHHFSQIAFKLLTDAYSPMWRSIMHHPVQRINSWRNRRGNTSKQQKKMWSMNARNMKGNGSNCGHYWQL